MYHLALATCFVGLATACGGGGGRLDDARPDQAFACDPIAQTGCTAGQKCTWIVDLDGTATSVELGHIGCAPTGASVPGAGCADARATQNGGVDGCPAGALCVAGACKPICDPQLVDGAGAGACARDHACSVYVGVFESAGDPVAGVCEPTCAPLTQQLAVASAQDAACGSPDPTRPSASCVASPGFRSFHCAPSDPMLYGKTDRQPPQLDPRGAAYINGCAPGFIPFYFEDASGAMRKLCTGLCAPLPVDATLAADPAHKDDNRGDRSVLGKLPGDPAPAILRATCDAGVKGSATAAPHGEDCRYLWFPLAGGDPNKALASPYNDTLGVCFAYDRFLTVTVPGMPQKQPEKSCAELPVATAVPDDPYGSARDNGCYPLAQSLGAGMAVRRAAPYRLSAGDGPAVRHVFD